ncbi:MAG: NAD(P)-dependent oxidoreductase [Eubacteriales bacterium]|nr:NAD(P)-dependent oxidoreductase [Eubacteriales bacterium]
MISSTESENKEFKKIGVVGIGTMGHIIVEKLLECGYVVNVFDVSKAALDVAEGKGAHITGTPAELANISDLIFMSLPGTEQIEEVIFGKNGLMEGLKNGSIVADTSTVDPKTSQNAAQRLSAKGIGYLDCPILGRPSAAGNWLLPVGGNIKDLERATPVLKSFASNIIHVGDHGAGNAVKLLNQMMFTVINAVSSEVMAIADYCGVSKDVFYNTVAGSSAATVSGLFKEVGKNIVANDFEHPTFTVDLLIKDTKLALQMAKDAGAPSIMAGTAQLYNDIATANGYGKEDTSALYKTYKRHFD